MFAALIILFSFLTLGESISLPEEVPQSSGVYVSSTDPFEYGELTVSNQTINGSLINDKITFLDAFYPEEQGVYAVNIFLTAFDGDIMAFSYSEVLSNISAHGFIVVGITTFPLYPQDITDEIIEAISWIEEYLPKYLPEGVQADFTNSLSLMGHSAGGKVVTEIVMRDCGQIRALVLLDPVDGNPMIIQSDPVNFTLPVFLMGTGLGNIAAQEHFPPCAPQFADFHHFYKSMACPKVSVNVTDYGHLDMLNEDQAEMWTYFCASGFSSGHDLSTFRHYTWGSVTAFLMTVFQDGCEVMDQILSPPMAISLETEIEISCAPCPQPLCSNP